MTNDTAANPTRMKPTTTVERTSDLEISVTRTFNATADLVFEAWRKPELFTRWWTPKSFGITFVSCEIDLRTGGSYKFVFSHPAAEQPMAFFGKYVDVKPNELIVWTNEEDVNGPVSSVTFKESNGKTVLTLIERYPTKEALDEAMANGSSGTAGAPEQFLLLDELLESLG